TFDYVNPAHATFFWLPNLSDKDPFLLPVLAGVTTYFQSKMTMTGNDPTQRMMMYTMPVFIGWISTTIPAGLVLYWVVFNLASIVQQYFINKQTLPLKGEVGGK
ncbi:MAG: YidC/Oxa1 family membrane protein insertase, partial [Desulfotomaculaceae bacterium]|nr:YidC/Oxa1 family membrane protein insertase [Desulfotomaculaceae bacterium]